MSVPGKSPLELPPLLPNSTRNANNKKSFSSNSMKSFVSVGTPSKCSYLSSALNPQDSDMIRVFKKTNDPFEQGYTRSDKMRFQDYNSEAHSRLFNFCTISSLNHSQLHNPPRSTLKVSGVEQLRKSFKTNPLMQEIVEEQGTLKKYPKLAENIESLWKMNLLQDKQVQQYKLPKRQNISYVYNDYHSRSTNPGYARNDKSGTFFTR